MGAGSIRHYEQSDEELFRRSLLSVVAHAAICSGPGIHQPGPVRWNLAGPWMGARAICRGAGIDVPDLHWNIPAVVGAVVLFLSASSKDGSLHLHVAAVHVFYAVERWDCVAGNEVSARGIAKGDGVRAGSEG